MRPRHEADSVLTASNEDAAMARADARQQAELLMQQAEDRGAERVVAIESAAQQEAAAMREPIRSEVAELEDVRARLLTDISELESHLEDQRVRVRTAVEALRVGMSGSIEDLERVADDDALLATQPAPPHSGASGADVAVAPDIEIIDRVSESVPDPATVDELEADALDGYESVAETTSELPAPPEPPAPPILTAVDPVLEEAPALDDEPALAEEPPQAEEPAADADTVADADTFEGVVADDDPMELDAEPLAVAETVEESGPDTEPIPVVATEAEVEEAELVVLDDEPTGMFGTDVGQEVDVAPTPPSAGAAALGAAVIGGAGVAGVGAAAVFEEPDEPESSDEDSVPVAAGGSFIDRFGAALDELPIVRD